MAYSAQRPRLARVAGASLVLLPTTYSFDPRYKCQVSGDEAYLEAAPLVELHAPAGMILPVTSDDYAIPVTNDSGAVGKALDIRLLAQPLAPVSGACTQFTGDTASLLVENGHGNTLWPQMVSVLQMKNYTATQRNDTGQTLTADWIQWNRLDEDEQYRGRYQISAKLQGCQQAVTAKLLNLEQAGKPVTDAASMQHYSMGMMNVISAGLDKSATDAANAVQNHVSTTMNVQSATGDVGLPMLAVYGPFNVVQQRLPAALEKVGTKVTNSTRSQGNMAVTYKPLSDNDWQELGVSDPGLASGDYKLQAGGLDNRSNLQFIDPRGHTPTQSQNDVLVVVFQAAFSK